MKSWTSEVIADSTGKWLLNGTRFATPKEARDYVWQLSMNWTAVKDTRVIASDEPVNYRFINGRAEAITDAQEA
jgi:hypothetical protein